jgi:hypothetical protein
MFELYLAQIGDDFSDNIRTIIDIYVNTFADVDRHYAVGFVLFTAILLVPLAVSLAALQVGTVL